MRLAHRATTSVAIVGALLTLGIPVASSTTSGSTGAEQTYLALYKQGVSTADAKAMVSDAGGTLVVNHSSIGVLVAKSNRTDFAAKLDSVAGVDGVAVSNTPVAEVGPLEADNHDGAPNPPATPDNLDGLQWHMRQIHAPEAHAITGGSPAVVVGDIDTGVDKDHPDLVQNIDFSKSVSCESGFPNPSPASWDDHNGHGTHTTGTMAAADNGFGITGVAPNVKIAAIKSSLDSGFFFVEMVVCSFLWAGGAEFDNPATPGVDFPATTGPRVDVTNNSYFMDPFLYNCRNDPAQRLLWKAAQRAILFAHSAGVTNVAAIGNDGDDRAHPISDSGSPNPGTPVERDITNACVVVPVEVPGVIGVTGVGNQRQVDGNDDPNDYRKSFFSAYGVGVADVTAPSGDSVFGITPEAPNGRVLSTYPQELPCTRSAADPTESPLPPGTSTYCYLQGTSMASPHAAGVAALIISRYGDLKNPQNGKMRPSAVEAYMQQTADSQPCPTALPPDPGGFFTRPTGEVQECQGGESYNSWYGSGQINALRAVTHDAGQ
jgi:subtilisin family serine protease